MKALEQGDLAAAAACFSAVLALDPVAPRALYGNAELARRRGDSREAFSLAIAALSGDPTHVGLHQLARALVKELGGETGSSEAARALLLKHPSVANVARLYCIHARQNGGAEVMYDGLLAAMGAAPDDDALRLLAAQELIRAGLPRAAKGVVGPLLAARPDDRAALIAAGDAALALKDDEGTVAYLGPALADESGPADNRRRIMLAAALKRLDRLDAAEAALAPVLAQADAPALAHEQAGHLARARGDTAAAIGHFEAAVGAEPASVRLRMLLMRGLRDVGRRAEAAAVVDAILADDPNVADAHLQRGEFALASKNYERAREAFECASRLAPADARPWQRLAHLAGLTAGAHAALEIMARGIAQARGPELLLAQSDLQFRRGLDAEAETSLRAAESIEPDAAAVRIMRIKRAIATGEHERARIMTAALPADSQRQRTVRHDLEGVLAEAQWRFDPAAAAYAAAAACDARSSSLQESLGRCVLMGLDPRRARRHFASARDLNRVTILGRGGSLNPSQSRYGALVNDAWCDGEALAMAQQAAGAEDIGPLLDAVRSLPHYTLAAIALLIRLRHAGRLNPKPDTEREGEANRRIPRLIHQYWDTRLVPDDVVDLMGSWAALNPAWHYRRLDRNEAQEYLRAHFPPNAARAFRRLRVAAQQADLVRLGVLLREGGVYADADDRCLADLSQLTARASLVLRQEHLGSLANNFIATAPGHPVVAAAFELAVESILRGDADSIWLSTGPGLMSRAVATYLAAERERLDEIGRDLLVLTPWQMRRFTAPACQASYKASAKSWLNQEFNARAS
ncbi:tetratricopeptide repeat protein [Chelatococcus reniformis]|uniref:Tetratricopeptide repeat protein n=1 Tax=Chelatococcus reniformis TaxID=1494448 RepID=A0A916U546_9HYPH|nr:tetratricopeptide repeat protein [Chelatococcus reniformis]GGC60321.1 hypothetical protein GCM10010994_18700 [Chelatococcus reniformis]